MKVRLLPSPHILQKEAAMGILINGEKFSVSDLVNDLEARIGEPAGKLAPKELLDKVMPAFGVVHEGYFFTVWNEYYEEGNPAWEFTKLVALYYGLVDTCGDRSWSPEYESYSYGSNAYDVAESLGIELGEEYEDE